MNYIPQDAEILHQATGLDIWRNLHNTFIIARVHHTADPGKRSPEWKRVASAGMTPGLAAREYDIDYSAVQGSKVFPEITERRSAIVVPPLGDLEGLRCWGGLDYGTRNAASFHVYTILDEVIYSVWELYEPCQNIAEWVGKVLACPYWSLVRYVAADPSLWIPNQQQAAGPPVGVATLLQAAGLRNLVKGRANPGAEGAWIAMMRSHWGASETTFRISELCPNQIREFETAIFVPQSERQLLTSVYQETIANRNNHSLDDCKYFMLSQPSKGGAPSDGAWRDPGQVYKLTGQRPPLGGRSSRPGWH